MRIISSFKDYYDSGVAYGIDPNLIYVREVKSQEIGRWTGIDHLKELQEACNGLPFFDGHKGVIAFCGRLYPFYKIASSFSITDYSFSYSKFFFSFKKMKEAFNGNYQDKIISSLKSRLSRITIQEIKSVDVFVKKTRYHINKISEKKKHKISISPTEHDEFYFGRQISDDAFRGEKSPIIIMETDSHKIQTVITNPKLKDYEFMMVKDPVTAFQEISTFLGSNLVEQKDPNPYMSDELKSEIHGFDKWSFRKPGKK
jgi:hypothetical protein